MSRMDHKPTLEDLDRYGKYRTSIYILEGRVFSLQTKCSDFDCFLALVGRKKNNVICTDRNGEQRYTINPNIIVDIAQKGQEFMNNNRLEKIELVGNEMTSHEFVVSDGDIRYCWGSCNNLAQFSEGKYAKTEGRKLLEFIRTVSEELVNNGVDEKYLKLV